MSGIDPSGMVPDAAAHLRGKYRHYKGGVYELVDVARHSETQEELVVYRASSGELWVRPREMFFETVTVDGSEVPRFERMTEL
ncbi:DUF1653 domain-containing protein [Salinibacterium sp. SYSU T00001]|uniref:DUF1653 domain-containing protein n=1 Tax=Homoserinimonas sedimenticola TaxID=2986805 RepID=UPI002236AABD|nr:DUF1653 domain-containing protein [Salinibacterium sedimenticola]MCW4384451.1 DUF1653 domain-containing protein [Salinibacterium sedimenticola]